jgi:hypothetical protein
MPVAAHAFDRRGSSMFGAGGRRAGERAMGPRIAAWVVLVWTGLARGQAWNEVGDAPSLPPGQTTVGPGALATISGALHPGALDSVDAYCIRITDVAAFGASTMAVGFDPRLWLFDESGHGMTFDDNDPAGGTAQARITGWFLPGPGMYTLAISSATVNAMSASNQLTWLPTPADVERAPDGPGAADPVAAWSLDPSVVGGSYVISLTGAAYCVFTGPCYANCDHSTTPPVLNVGDFVCFLSAFAAGDSYANCDGSTTAPVLNIADFVCFQQAFAAGCP